MGKGFVWVAFVEKRGGRFGDWVYIYSSVVECFLASINPGVQPQYGEKVIRGIKQENLCEDTARRQLSTSLGEKPPEKPTPSVVALETPVSRDEESISVV